MVLITVAGTIGTSKRDALYTPYLVARANSVIFMKQCICNEGLEAKAGTIPQCS
jgi:hypothetical protein